MKFVRKNTDTEHSSTEVFLGGYAAGEERINMDGQDVQDGRGG